MKKFISGMLCGVLLFAGVTVSAQSINNVIGKKVDGASNIVVNGKRISEPAITVEGKSYLPVRSFTEAVGGKVLSVKNGTIELSTEGGGNLEQIISEEAKKQQEEWNREAQAKNITSLLESKKKALEVTKAALNEYQRQLENGQDIILVDGFIPFEESDAYKKLQAEITKKQEEVSKLETEIAELEKQLAELQKSSP